MMNPPRSLSRRSALPRFVLLAALLTVACGEDAPTGHKPDPLVGRWEGEFTSLMGGQSVSDAFVIVVIAGGEGTGTGYYTYDYQGAQVAEQICITLEATADGILSGAGLWFFRLPEEGGLYYAEATIDGWLDAVNGIGSGDIVVGPSGEVGTITWDVTKGEG